MGCVYIVLFYAEGEATGLPMGSALPQALTNQSYHNISLICS